MSSNPYEAPNATLEIAREADDAKPKRPGWVWAISIYFAFCAVFTIFSCYFVITGAVPLNPGQADYFQSLSIFDYAVSIAIAVLNLSGAVTLFLLRKISFYFFTCALCGSIVLTVWHSATKGWAQAAGSPGLVGTIIGYGLLSLVCFYSWRLMQRGTLR